MGFHYQRTPWEGGGVCRLDGEPAGARLGDLLRPGLPPTRPALDLWVAFCEILYIAQEDGAVHGDLGLEHAWLNGDGTISLGGYGPERRVTRAPEGASRGARTDLYGLGRLGAALLVPGSAELSEVPTSGANAHDEAVRALLGAADLGIDEGQVAEDLRWFIARLLRFDPADRPDALKVWKALVPVARSRTGVSLEAWAMDAHRGVAARREGTTVEVIERLEGPKVQAGPLTRGLRFSDPGYQTRTWVIPPEVRQPARTREARGEAPGAPADAVAGTPGLDRGGTINVADLRALAREAGLVGQAVASEAVRAEGERGTAAPAAGDRRPPPGADPGPAGGPAGGPVGRSRSPRAAVKQAEPEPAPTDNETRWVDLPTAARGAAPVAEGGGASWFGAASQPVAAAAPEEPVAPEESEEAIPLWLLVALGAAALVLLLAVAALVVALVVLQPGTTGG